MAESTTTENTTRVNAQVVREAGMVRVVIECWGVNAG